MTQIKLGTYQHFKGTFAKVIGVGKHTETLEEFVVYEHIEKETGKNILWVRPLTMFLEKVDVNGEEVLRFQYIGE